MALEENANYSLPNIYEYYKLLLESFIERNVNCIQAMSVGYKYSKFFSVLSMLYPSATLSRQRLEMVDPASERLLTLIMQQQLQSLHMLYIKWIKQLIMQHPHTCSLGNVARTDLVLVLGGCSMTHTAHSTLAHL
jgi:hypothetical protein